ncbi:MULTISPECIES: DEAD/DEAH box helicase [Atopobiaceae]|uniref:Helicase conserved C-terminal domain-containing protein n=1 Tax=Parafannyhessea umbonata TaxID=604330 RepID=A0A1H6HU57_9ACTN|nr:MULTISPECIES: DEAD/DEAH box helicase [Atopobiaceae]SEH37665.1 Helicase conserved C-terminal domain-containing protein [Parafannyhessea umbonata]SJZ40035.1 Helicase conserved C-terminal domain-containing protein [Olsenella sp. KH1P3]
MVDNTQSSSAVEREEVDEGANGEASLGRLIPWPDDDSYADIPADEALDLFLEWCESRGIELWDHQEEALLDLASGSHVILGTPTGSGKSLVALGLCFISVCTNRRAYYTAPIKALVSEKFFDLVRLFGRDNVGMITGDVTVNSGAPIICCTAEILANDALRGGEDADIGCVAMDEFHYFGDHGRGWAWQVPLLTLPHTQFLLMSATLGDTSGIASSLEAHSDRSVELVAGAERPVPLSYRYVDTPLEATVELALKSGEAPLYIVHFSQEAAVKSATSLSSYGVSTKEQREKVKEAIAGTRFTTTFGKTLRRLLITGVGVHHAGMLPRYRLLVERLAQQGLLPVICGTDTLGVGINVPIHTVLLTALSKFDGRRMRHLNAREFHQIAGRAGRSGFDTEGLVIAEATEYDIENARALAKAGGDPKKARKIKTKQPPKGFVGWKEATFDKLIASEPEALKPHMRISHSLVLSEVEQGGDAYARTHKLIDDSAQGAEEKDRLHTRTDEIFATLIDAGVVRKEEEGGQASYVLTVDLPDNFALDQPLSPFLLASLELLDPENDDYDMDLISMVEATLEDPPQILRALQRRARNKAMDEMKADGVDYNERMALIQDVTYPKPLEELLDAAFERYSEEVPWAGDYELSPKSVLRDMIETASDFKGYVQRCGIARSEGTLLRYLSDAYHVLDRTVPQDKMTDRLYDIVAWLRLVVRSVDSSLIDEWEQGGSSIDEAGTAPQDPDEVVRDRRALTLLVRNALFARVRDAAFGNTDRLGDMDGDWGWRSPRWSKALHDYHEAHEEILLTADAHSSELLLVDESLEHGDAEGRHVWRVRQMFLDEDGERDFGISGDVDLDATQEEGEAIFSRFQVGFIEDLLESEGK